MDGFDRGSELWNLVALLLPLIFAITLHEVAHGWVAKRFGDPTAANAGRLTLNPIKHVDLIGTIIVPTVCYLLMGIPFGWAKPVPVDFRQLNNPRRDMILVAAAGPGSNLFMALLWMFMGIAAYLYLPIWGEGNANLFIDDMAKLGIFVNLIIAVFNMLPVPPLDGGRVLAGLLPPPMAKVLDTIEPFGILIVLGLLVADTLTQFEFFVPFVLRPVYALEDVYQSLADYLLMLAGAA